MAKQSHDLAAAAAAAFLAIAIGTGALPQTPDSVGVRGTVASREGSMLKVKSRDGGDISVHLKDKWGVASVVKASLSDIKAGTFIGTATLPQDNGARALEVLVFPESLRGSGEGDYPWDLQPHSSMTNATVGNSVIGVDGQTVTLSYKGGEKKVTIPRNAPIVTLGPAEQGDVKPGVQVFVRAKRAPDGSLDAGFVLIGKNGVEPPM